ncbi:MAG: MBL fold metallo-hydrolase [Actinomycetota bacterium]
MRLTVLGCSAWPGPGGAASGYLVQHDGFNLLVDCGNGTLAKLQEHIEIRDIGAVLVTHAHPDHFADLYSLWVAVAFGEQADRGIPLYAPPGFMDTVTSVSDESSSSYVHDTFSFNPVHPGGEQTVGSVTVTAFGMNHPRGAVGYRVEAGGAVLAYTGDTGPTDRVTDLARGAGAFVCEATFQGDPPDDYPFHLSGTQAGEYATAAGVERLVLTHLWPSNDAAVTRSQAERAFDGEIVMAESGMELEVG